MRCAAWLHALDSKDRQSKDYTLKVYNVGSACKTMMQQNQYDHWINVQRSSWCFIQFHKIKRVLFIGKIQSCVSLFSRNVFFLAVFFCNDACWSFNRKWNIYRNDYELDHHLKTYGYWYFGLSAERKKWPNDGKTKSIRKKISDHSLKRMRFGAPCDLRLLFLVH